MKHKLQPLCFVLVLFAVFCFEHTLTAEPQENINVIAAFQIKRLNNFLKEPSSYAIEILRRFGRVFNIQFAANNCVYASIFNPSKIGRPDFLRPIPQNMLSLPQAQKANGLLASYSACLAELINSCRPSEQSIIITGAAESADIKRCLKTQAAHFKAQSQKESLKTLEKLNKMQSEIMPFFNKASYFAGAMVISKNGCFGQLDIIASSGALLPQKPCSNISIGGYINEKHLMSFCQAHQSIDTNAVYNQITSAPQASVILNALASAGLDLKKDILSNFAKESIIYVNLEPKDQTGLPEIICAAAVPNIKKIIADLPKYKQYCVLCGVFARLLKETPNIVKLSHFIMPNFGVYAGIINNFIVISNTESGVKNEIEHIAGVDSAKIKPFKLNGEYKRYWQIHTEDFNRQLQIFLQSKLFKGKKIPPISNLTFLKDMQTVVITTKESPQKLSFRINLPLNEK